MKVLITGTNRGIGRACAAKFLAENHEVYGIDIQGDTISAAKDIPDSKNYTHFTADISKKTSLPDINGIEILINNAGIQTASLESKQERAKTN